MHLTGKIQICISKRFGKNHSYSKIRQNRNFCRFGKTYLSKKTTKTGTGKRKKESNKKDQLIVVFIKHQTLLFV